VALQLFLFSDAQSGAALQSTLFSTVLAVANTCFVLSELPELAFN
jgi:hypothetical protein